MVDQNPSSLQYVGLQNEGQAGQEPDVKQFHRDACRPTRSCFLQRSQPVLQSCANRPRATNPSLHPCRLAETDGASGGRGARGASVAGHAGAVRRSPAQHPGRRLARLAAAAGDLPNLACPVTPHDATVTQGSHRTERACNFVDKAVRRAALVVTVGAVLWIPRIVRADLTTAITHVCAIASGTARALGHCGR
jgi:hypothetical protein